MALLPTGLPGPECTPRGSPGGTGCCLRLQKLQEITSEITGPAPMLPAQMDGCDSTWEQPVLRWGRASLCRGPSAGLRLSPGHAHQGGGHGLQLPTQTLQEGAEATCCVMSEDMSAACSSGQPLGCDTLASSQAELPLPPADNIHD